jgi:hypothetical protein
VAVAVASRVRAIVAVTLSSRPLRPFFSGGGLEVASEHVRRALARGRRHFHAGDYLDIARRAARLRELDAVGAVRGAELAPFLGELLAGGLLLLQTVLEIRLRVAAATGSAATLSRIDGRHRIAGGALRQANGQNRAREETCEGRDD